MEQINQLVREQLPADPSEIESHLLSHFASELGGREGSIGGEVPSDDEELEIDFQDKPAKTGKKTATGKKEESVKSRARARKPHEPKPFLSIGNIPPQKTKRLDPLKGIAHDIRQPSFLSNPNVPFNTPSRMMASRNSNIYPMSAASSEWNSVIPKQYKQKQAVREMDVMVPENIHVSAPFKHSVLKPPAKTQRPPSPGEALRGKTMAGTHMVAKVMAKQKPALTPRSAGKLLKGKLKPMTPVVAEGPHIKHCMGIVPQQQSYSASASRTVNRRRQIISTMIEKNLFPTGPLRPETVESLHRTSIASSLDENRLDEVKEEIAASPDKSPVAPPPSAAVEDVNSINQSETMAENREMDEQKRSGSFFVTESEDADNVPNSELSSFKGLESEVASRPRTAVESQLRKVHFADAEINSSDSARRSRSAAARLHPKVSSQQSKKSKKEEQGQGDTNMAVAPSIDTVDQNVNNDSVTPNHTVDVNTVQEEEGNTNNNGNQERRQALQMAVTDVKQGFNGSIQGEKRGNPSVGRVRARRGQWEDTCKPDPYVKDLNINTCKPGSEVMGRTRTGSYNMRKTFLTTGNGKDSTRGRRSRPQSAGGPASFLLQEERRTINTARPRSAYVQSTPGMQVESSGAQLNQRGRPYSASVSYAIPKSRRGRRAYAHVDVSEYDHNLDESKRETIALAHYVQNSRSHVCEVCAVSSFRCAEFDGKMVCEICKERNERMNAAEIVGKSRMDNGMSKSESDKENDDAENEELLVSLGDIESSLNQVQEEIKASKAKNDTISAVDLYNNGVHSGDLVMSPSDAKTPFDMLELEAPRAPKVMEEVQHGDTNFHLLGIDSASDLEKQRTDYPDNRMYRCHYSIEPEAVPIQRVGEMEMSLSKVQQEVKDSRDDILKAERSLDKKQNDVPMETRKDVSSEQRPGSHSNFLGNVLQSNSGHSEDLLSPSEAKTPFDMLELEASRAPKVMKEAQHCDTNFDLIDIEPTVDLELQRTDYPNYKIYHCDNSMESEAVPIQWVNEMEASLNKVQQGVKDSRDGISKKERNLDKKEHNVPIETRNDVSSEQRPGSHSSFLENVLTIDEEMQKTTVKSKEKEAKVPKYELDDDQTIPSNMTVYQYAELEPDQESNGNIAKRHKTPNIVKTEGGQSGGIIEGQISSYQTNLLQPYVEDIYMCDITGTRGDQTPTLPASPYPPLCFHVNARPPSGHVYYFAYGVDMNPTRFATYIGHEVVERYWGLLFGFKLTFNRKGVDQDAIGFPNVQTSANSSVEGALYLLKTEELAMVDGHMGYPEYVEKVMLPVWFLNCTEPDELGVAQYCIPAVTYVARDAWTLSDMRGVSTEFSVRQCVRGADLVSPAYKEYIISQIM